MSKQLLNGGNKCLCSHYWQLQHHSFQLLSPGHVSSGVESATFHLLRLKWQWSILVPLGWATLTHFLITVHGAETFFPPVQGEKISPPKWSKFALSATWNEIIMHWNWASIALYLYGTLSRKKCMTLHNLWANYAYSTLDISCVICAFSFLELLIYFMQINFLGSWQFLCILAVPGTDHERRNCTFLLWTHGWVSFTHL